MLLSLGERIRLSNWGAPSIVEASQDGHCAGQHLSEAGVDNPRSEFLRSADPSELFRGGTDHGGGAVSSHPLLELPRVCSHNGSMRYLRKGLARAHLYLRINHVSHVPDLRPHTQRHERERG